MIITSSSFHFFRSYFSRIAPKTLQYRKYKTFNESSFLHELDQELLKGEKHKKQCIKTMDTCSQLLQKPSEEFLINMHHGK